MDAIVRGNFIEHTFPTQGFQDHLRLELAPMLPSLDSYWFISPGALACHTYSVVHFLGYIIIGNDSKKVDRFRTLLTSQLVPRIAAAAIAFRTGQASDRLRRMNTHMLIDVLQELTEVLIVLVEIDIIMARDFLAGRTIVTPCTRLG
jgi:hypothetical protein